jgi:hypothetical protein
VKVELTCGIMIGWVIGDCKAVRPCWGVFKTGFVVVDRVTEVSSSGGEYDFDLAHQTVCSLGVVSTISQPNDDKL